MREDELTRIVLRRFGSAHERPCAHPQTKTCAQWKCQVANRCMRAFGEDTEHGSGEPEPPMDELLRMKGAL